MVFQGQLVDGITAVGHPVNIGLTGLVLWWMQKFGRRFEKLEKKVRKLNTERKGRGCRGNRRRMD